MPRDLQHELDDQATAQTLESMPGLSTQSTSLNMATSESEDLYYDTEEQQIEGVRVYPKALTLSDLDACCILEDTAFPPEQRCSREKFIYRLTVAPELCHGLFTTASPDYEPQHLKTAETAKAACSVESSSPRKQILIAHAIGTLSTNNTVLDEDMALPPGWNDASVPKDPKLGHKPEGRVAMLHSLAVLPSYQGKHIGSTLLKGYIDLLRASGNYDRLALLADDHHVKFYEKHGFTNLGPSKAGFGGVSWNDMVLDFKHGAAAHD
ncbi:uncharacterized protein PV09_03034 [Verruconis gallopava]|uniref:N-acetyltransferase domain-containing protein n=1 Tax=Verruconis gallopava TaxID=253628 RepID=A0A0D2AFS9_9PEZI|nr:uncharacterized protein PV09_03034 [Verruconis gallopava]KIW05828.1 hypothetical protein PV09_03034 [Verruconis gallopava]